MKYGSELSRRSVPEWKAHNIDYNEIKALIKKATVKGNVDKSEAIAKVLEVLNEEYEAVNLFVKSKSGEIDRRIDDCEKIVDNLAEQEDSSLKSGLGYSLNSKVRQGKLYRLHQAITRLTRDIQALSRFIGAQTTGFRKLVKKYRKWTDSTTDDMAPFWKRLSSPQSFANHDFTSNFLELALLYDVLRNAKFTTVRKRLELPHDSLCKYDTEMVSSVSASSIFLVHQDNVMEVSVALLKELRLVSSDVGVANHTQLNQADVDSTEVIYLDTSKLEYAQTGKEPPQIRKVNDSTSVLCSPTGGLRHFANCDLTSEELQLILNDKAQEIDFDRLDTSRKLAIGWIQQKRAKSMSKVAFSRNRFSYFNDEDDREVVNNNSNNKNLQTHIWATMDSNIKLESTNISAFASSTASSSSKEFPHSVLEIRWNGISKPKWVSELESSHLVYPMKHGFSLYAYSVVSFYSDQLQKLPSWLEIIDNGVEIRQTPKATTMKRSANSSANLNNPDKGGKNTPSATPSILLNDSHTVPGGDYFTHKSVSHKASTTFENDLKNEGSPQMLSRVSSFYNPTSRQQHRLQSQPSESKLAVRYWNEFDDPEDGDQGIFVIPDDDSGYQDKLFSEANLDALVRVSDRFLQSFAWLGNRLFGISHREGYEQYRERRYSDSEEDDFDDDDDDDEYDEEASVGRYSPRIKPRSSSTDTSEYDDQSYYESRNSSTIAARRRNNVLTFLYAMCFLLSALIISTLLSVTILEDLSEISLGTYIFMILGFIFALGVSMLGISLYLLCKPPPWWHQTIVFASFFSIVCFGVGGIAWILA